MRVTVARKRLPTGAQLAGPIDATTGVPCANADFDAYNQICPISALLLRRHFRQARKEHVVRISVTDPGAPEDFRRFCKNTGDTLLAVHDMRSHNDVFVRKS